MAKHDKPQDNPQHAMPGPALAPLALNSSFNGSGVKAEVNPERAFRDAWNANQDKMREILTKNHEIRSGLKPSEKARAQALLESYGLR